MCYILEKKFTAVKALSSSFLFWYGNDAWKKLLKADIHIWLSILHSLKDFTNYSTENIFISTGGSSPPSSNIAWQTQINPGPSEPLIPLKTLALIHKPPSTSGVMAVNHF